VKLTLPRIPKGGQMMVGSARNPPLPTGPAQTIAR
jgi:hypothetical protein